jgi:hypothetical protein
MTPRTTLCRSIFVRGIPSRHLNHCPLTLEISAIQRHKLWLSFRRHKTSANVLPNSRDLVRVDEQKSVSWEQLHDRSPASYGILTASAYEEMIPAGALLPSVAQRNSRQYSTTLKALHLKYVIANQSWTLLWRFQHSTWPVFNVRRREWQK